MRSAILPLIALFLCPFVAGAQGSPDTTDAGAELWTGAANVYFYLFPHDESFALPIVSAEKGQLHLEARYNYENFRTVSFWAGWKFSAGEELWVEAIPMAGLVAGNTDGAAPGLELSAGYGMLEFYTEMEYVFDFAGGESNFFYSWSELTISPTVWLRCGLVGQRLREVESDVEISPGLLAGIAFRRFALTAYVLNTDPADRFYVVSLGYTLE